MPLKRRCEMSPDLEEYSDSERSQRRHLFTMRRKKALRAQELHKQAKQLAGMDAGLLRLILAGQLMDEQWS